MSKLVSIAAPAAQTRRAVRLIRSSRPDLLASLVSDAFLRDTAVLNPF